ncbi:DoxX family protein [Chitinophaga sp.]|uniref:DoxX family protein n=1 Tax=Chitinophaga sp. TaxID=1869181 RepID=UPI002BC01E3F|nr:DoxX family protein [Chitinophaga sp.]HWV68772.1 DoxX family protein [Chitinophaga sp.]
MKEDSVKISADGIQNYQKTWDRKFNQLEQTLKNKKMKTKNNRGKNIAYWITTILLVLGMASGGIAQLLRVKQNVEGTVHLGYPVYIMSILGTWKILGILTLLLPKFRLLKEWAYAGFFFVLSGAVISHIVSGDNFSRFGAPLIFVLLTIASWALRPDDRKLPVSTLAL